MKVFAIQLLSINENYVCVLQNANDKNLYLVNICDCVWCADDQTTIYSADNDFR